MNRKLTTILAAAAALMIVPAATFAHDRDHDDHDRWNATGGVRVNFDFGRPHVEERATQVWVEPVYQTAVDHVWVAPTYRTVTDRVWCPPVTQNVTQRVWIPDRFEGRDVVRYEHGRRCIVRENVLVAPGHYEDRVTQVEVTPGHYDEAQHQELVCAGHYEDVQRQVLVAPGHFETRVAEIEHRDSVAVRFPIRW